MKKNYMQPAVEVMNMNASAMMATSMKINDIEVDTSNGAQLGREEEDLGGAWDTEW